MSTTHKQYPGLMVYFGQKGEQPSEGAFYVPKPGDNLTSIAKAAYGSKDRPLRLASIINRSEYNLGMAKVGALTYRVDSSSCKSSTLKKAYPDKFKAHGYRFVSHYPNGVERSYADDKAWLSLCPSVLNAYGSVYQPIWIPTFVGRSEPEKTPSGGSSVKIPPIIGLKLPQIRTDIPAKKTPVQPSVKVPIGGGGLPGIGGGSSQDEGDSIGYKPPKLSRAGFPKWAGYLLGAGVLGGLYYWYRTAKS